MTWSIVYLLYTGKFCVYCVYVSGILIFIGLFITFSHANAVVKREIAKQSRRSLASLLLIVCNLLACILFIYYLFQNEKLYLRYFFAYSFVFMFPLWHSFLLFIYLIIFIYAFT